ncbi:MAG: SEC59/DGK1/VTE5 family protein [Spirochaetaceae bacterium]|nr:SEC59/DGK1/VTE5 family protein [Spirochaetaceae bacterium]
MENPICGTFTQVTQARRITLKKEFVRKGIHLCTALVPVSLRLHYRFTIASLALLLAVYCTAEALRRHGHTIPLVSALTMVAARARDAARFVLGPVTLVVGVLITALAFPPIPAAVGIYALAFGDGFASLAGKLWGRTPNPFAPGKTVVGTLACFIAVFLSAFAVTGSPGQAFAIALAGMFLESLPLKDFDNLVIPIALAALNQALPLGNR